MNEFEKNNNQQNENTEGFDVAKGETQSSYTVTPNGSFYSHKSENIIQDELSNTDSYYDTSKKYSNHNDNSSYNYYSQNNSPNVKQFKSRKNPHNTVMVLITAILSAVIGATSCMLVMGNITDVKLSSNSEIQTVDSNKSNVNINVEKTVSSVAEAVAEKCIDSVVGIRTTTSVTSFFGGSQEQSGEGSGVIYTSDGYIITNYHVISDAVQSSNSKIEVFTDNDKSTSYTAEVVGYNISCDIAVIKINAEGLVPVELGNSDELNVGQYVITIGAPGGLEFMGSVTYGIISGLDRVVSTDSNLKLIQTDAAINPGNSGGALLNSNGQLIGINSSKIVSEDFEGMGFAIPINTVKEKCDKIISRKNDSQAYFGVSISSTYTSEVLSWYGYPSGAVVSSVVEGSPADKAGISRGDIITEFNGITISEYTVLSDALYECEPNDKVDVKIYRNGRYYSVKITLASDTAN